MGQFDPFTRNYYYHLYGRTCKSKTTLENNCIVSSNQIHVHVHKGVLPLDILTEVQIHLNFSSYNPKIIHGQVKLTQTCPKQAGV